MSHQGVPLRFTLGGQLSVKTFGGYKHLSSPYALLMADSEAT